MSIDSPVNRSLTAVIAKKAAFAFGTFLLAAFVIAAPAQQPAPPLTQSDSTQQPSSSAAAQILAIEATSAPTSTPRQSASDPNAFSIQSATGTVSDDQIRQLLLGKTLYLRGGYLDNTLNFDEHGRLISHSPQGSYTLSAIQVEKVHVTKHKVEVQGQRYALHFLGALPYEDPTKAVDKVKITQKKKVLKISIDREQVEKQKKRKEKDKSNSLRATIEPQQQIAEDFTSVDSSALADGARSSSTTSPAHASKLLADALDHVFAPGIDDRMIAAMPDFWKLYYEAAEAKTDYRPKDPRIFRQTNVDQKAKLISTLEPSSNEYAQTNGVAGIALYHAVIDADGKPREIVAGRPIGFGLDENAVDTIRKATFQPAIKDGKPVPVWLDLVVSFRIYSKRTSEPGVQEATNPQADLKLPGPYSLQH